MSDHTFKRIGLDDLQSGDVVKMKGAGRHGPPAGDYTVSSWPPADTGHFSGYGGSAGRRAMRTLHRDLIVSARRLVPKKTVEEPPAAEVKPQSSVILMVEQPADVDGEPAKKPAARKTTAKKTTAKKRSTSGKTTRKS